MEEGYLVTFYLKNKKVYERICKSSSKLHAISTASRNYDSKSNFDAVKVSKVKLSYEIIED